MLSLNFVYSQDISYFFEPLTAPVFQDQLGVDALSEGLSAALDPLGQDPRHAHGRALGALRAADWELDQPAMLGVLLSEKGLAENVRRTPVF